MIRKLIFQPILVSGKEKPSSLSIQFKADNLLNSGSNKRKCLIRSAADSRDSTLSGGESSKSCDCTIFTSGKVILFLAVNKIGIVEAIKVHLVSLKPQ